MRISPHLRLVPIAGLLACAEPGGLLLPGNGGDAGSRDADGGELRQGDASVVVDLDAGLEPCWTLGPSIPLLAPPARGYAAAAFDDRCGRLLMFSGDAVVPSACEPSSMARLLNDLVVYDVVTQTWHEMPVVPRALSRVRAARPFGTPNANVFCYSAVDTGEIENPRGTSLTFGPSIHARALGPSSKFEEATALRPRWTWSRSWTGRPTG